MTSTCPAWQSAGTNSLRTLLSSVRTCPRPPEPPPHLEGRQVPAERFSMARTLRHNTSHWMLFTFCVMPFPVSEHRVWLCEYFCCSCHRRRFFEVFLLP